MYFIYRGFLYVNCLNSGNFKYFEVSVLYIISKFSQEFLYKNSLKRIFGVMFENGLKINFS